MWNKKKTNFKRHQETESRSINSSTSMEICSNNMDNLSQQYYAGMAPDQQMSGDEFSFNFADQSNFVSSNEYPQQIENYPESGCVGAAAAGIVCDNNSANWLSENVKCKREIDLTDISHHPAANSTSAATNFDTVSIDEYNNANCSREFNDSYRQYDPTMKYINDANSNIIHAPPPPSFAKPHLPTSRHHQRSYHISSMNNHNQIPNWYAPPSSSLYYEPPPPPSPQFHPAYPSHFRENYLHQPPQQIPHAEADMRNMMNMSNRYLLLLLK